jgi:hypothetical protein
MHLVARQLVDHTVLLQGLDARSRPRWSRPGMWATASSWPTCATPSATAWA